MRLARANRWATWNRERWDDWKDWNEEWRDEWRDRYDNDDWRWRYRPIYLSNYYYGGTPYYAPRIYTVPTTYSYGVAGSSSVAAMQARLAREGYYSGPVDGIIGPRTRAAMARFERDHGLPVSAVVTLPLQFARRVG